MYHYVREPGNTRYPAIKGRTLDEFHRQLDHLQAHYDLITAETLMDAVAGQGDLPEKAALLTFDDGYLDHFLHVLPILDARGLQGSFFSVAGTVMEGRFLDVNRIHLILAGKPDLDEVVAWMRGWLARHREKWPLLESWEKYWQRHARANRYDGAAIRFIKEMLQKGLPAPVRREILADLFAKYVSVDEKAIVAETYMNLEQIRMLTRMGMYVGCHGYDHEWMDAISPAAREKDLDQARLFMEKEVGLALDDRWIMCYPYGGYDKGLMDLLQARGCAVGLTIDVGVADLTVHHPLALPRLDTNDLPS